MAPHLYDHESMFEESQVEINSIHNDDDDDASVGGKERREMRRDDRRTWVIAFFVVLMGAAATVCFLYVGLSSARSSEQERFERHADELSKEIVSSFRDYETAASWIHEACRDWREGDFTREDFRVLYNYIIDGGLDFFLAEWVPNITHAERPALEAEATAYYANDTNVDYNGFLGLGPNPEDPEEFGLFPSPEEPVYFPIQYLEPYERIGVATHLDLYSIVYEREAIDLAVELFEPVLTERFVIVSQETDGYSVSLIHPGIKLPDDIRVEPRDLSLMLIHIRSLLARAARFQGVSLSVYLYDATMTNKEGSPQQYLGGAKIEVPDNAEKEITYYTEVELEEVQNGAGLYYEKTMEAGARDWTIVVVPVNDSYEAGTAFVIICGVLIFASSLLLAWIWIMHNRKRSHHVENIINKAAAESAIVSSLFPAAVRKRLIQQNANKPEPASGIAADPEIQSIKKASLDGDKTSERHSTPVLDDSMPIAEAYLNTTILFADLAGFTFWSSKRDPPTVFKLLETFYRHFDEIAKRRHVFKVETIGDCYVAVTGVPKKQTKHAVIMAVFASECMAKMNELVMQLANEFGEDTLDLQMRVGINSGPVTAGVLRGEKSRFQLFGDSVNTASRMESNGEKGRIHCSQSTADALILAGKAHWLTSRADTIVAKGKGKMQTYWISISPQQWPGGGGSASVASTGDSHDSGQDDTEDSTCDGDNKDE